MLDKKNYINKCPNYVNLLPIYGADKDVMIALQFVHGCLLRYSKINACSNCTQNTNGGHANLFLGGLCWEK